MNAFPDCAAGSPLSSFRQEETIQRRCDFIESGYEPETPRLHKTNNCHPEGVKRPKNLAETSSDWNSEILSLAWPSAIGIPLGPLGHYGSLCSPPF